MPPVLVDLALAKADIVSVLSRLKEKYTAEQEAESSYDLSAKAIEIIDYLKEHLFDHFPINYHNAQVRDAFHKSLPEAFQGLEDDIRDYFTHLECAGPKLAHYAGYIIANNILPWVEPGYREDYCQTLAFATKTEKYMGILPL